MTMTFILYQKGFCTNCGNDRGDTIICKSCGWTDPPTTQNENEAIKIRNVYKTKKCSEKNK